MNHPLRSLRLVAPLLFVMPLAAGDPLSLQQGMEIVLTPTGGPSSITLSGNQLTLGSDTIMRITPDPLGINPTREWTLPAGTVITFNLGSGLSLRRMDLRRSVEFEVTSQTEGVQTFAATPSTLVIDPDPGTGR